ncbi:bifunctional diaminohydroxyphosphoribosylaminopyrimidine deaminase/5-amino-6-(5-phosphoribosylamino)uracil reductase RibD [Olivibacter sitiensis]|uniref:bifunctional diaminohydroxyphosphoribosylaminopyrimidine deaminase/5-amino-6-(5-phosphoribosylamino)uracil reductase RibD n=1 Tax=Olivibacter sitiensis TaxID=376470 RepID=UPI00047F7468|nr:bifunctional diaminohydroxyphosphoribosylaminopyrimidine deaminase/5-amino-6-(5-phosphoribosylamino)uracil reductase RibD [Olivibacter sitiensis]
MSVHETYMRRCIELAMLGAGKVSPNPMVGAVIVHNGEIVGEGWHQKYGGPHAEVNAIQEVIDRHGANAKELLQNAAMYVSLEPCAHFGKTPPCADLIVRHQIPEVIIACNDPFPNVNGRGIAKLQAAGIDVTQGILEKEATFMNRRFFTRVQRHRPYIILKWAETADGYFAPSEPSQKWISGPLAKIMSHKWRSEEDAILVGAGTAQTDNPMLNVREYPGRNPKRIIIDKNLTLAPHLHLFDNRQETIVFNALETDWKENTKYIALENFDLYLPQNIMYQLYLMDIQSVIIEGGVKTLEQFITAGLWDEARIFRSDTFWGRGRKAPTLPTIPADSERIGNDILNLYLNTDY